MRPTLLSFSLLLGAITLLGACQPDARACENHGDCPPSRACLNGTCRESAESVGEREGDTRGGGATTSWNGSPDATGSRRDGGGPLLPPSDGASLSCYQIQTCGWLYCKQRPGNRCESRFFERARPGATGKFQRFRTCTQQNGCQTAAVTRCARNQCSSKLNRCFEVEADGALTCSQIVQCLYECDSDDMACRKQCLERASSSAKSTYAAFARCSKRKCSADLNSEKGRRCLRSRCLDTFDDCFECR